MIDQAHAERMRGALEEIVDGLDRYDDCDPDVPQITPGGVLRIARRALDPDEWERVRD